MYFLFVYIYFVLNCYENKEIISFYVNDVSDSVVEVMISG